MTTGVKKFNYIPNVPAIQIQAGTDTKAPLSLISGTLKTTPISGDVEFDGSRYYGTTSSRQTFAFTSDIIGANPKYIDVISNNSNNIGYSANNNSGYRALTPPNWNTLQGSNISGSKTATNQFTRSSGTWTVNAEIDKYYLVKNSTEAQLLKVKANTTTVLTFYENIYITTPTTISLLSSSQELFWNLGEKYIDTGFTGSAFQDALFDGTYLWLVPQDTETKLYKINIFTYEVTTIPHSLNASDIVCLLYDGVYIYGINQNGGNHIRVNSKGDPNSTVVQTLSSNLTQVYTAVFDGTYVWVFGRNGSTFAYNRYDLYGNVTNFTTATLATSKRVFGLLCYPEKPNIIYMAVIQPTVDGSFFIYTYNTSTDSFDTTIYSLSLSNSPSFMGFAWDGYTWNICYTSSLFTTTVLSFSPYINRVVSSAGVNTAPNNNLGFTFDGENFLLTGTQSGGLANYTYLLNIYVFQSVISSSKYCQSYYFGNSNRLLYTDYGYIQWGGRYISKGALTKQGNTRKNVGNTPYQTILEKGVVNSYKSINSDYTLELRDYGLFIDTSAARVITLLDASKCKNQVFKFKDDTGNASVNNVTINTVNSQTIDGFGSSLVANSNWFCYDLVSNGTNWRVI